VPADTIALVNVRFSDSALVRLAGKKDGDIYLAYWLAFDAAHRAELHHVRDKSWHLTYEISIPTEVHFLASFTCSHEDDRKKRTRVQQPLTAAARTLNKHSKRLTAGEPQELHHFYFVERKHVAMLACLEFRANNQVRRTSGRAENCHLAGYISSCIDSHCIEQPLGHDAGKHPVLAHKFTHLGWLLLKSRINLGWRQQSGGLQLKLARCRGLEKREIITVGLIHRKFLVCATCAWTSYSDQKIPVDRDKSIASVFIAPSERPSQHS
jgi:hypothetical protein